MTIRLCADTLPQIAATAAIPAYDRAALTPGIVHFGEGNIHRAHQAGELDALLNKGLGRDWALLGAGVLPSDAAMRDVLTGQDFLTTVVEQSAADSAARVTGPMIGFLPVGDAIATIVALTDPAIRIVSLTITEGGYCIDPATGAFNPDHPAMVADAARPDAPQSVFGLIAAALRARRAKGIPAFTVMSCDNIPHNGHVARDAVAGLARLWNAEFGDWVAANVAFPSGMVDRITPATSDRERTMLRDGFGIEDAFPVFCEDFTQWVLEDNFPAGRPPLEDVGVQFVPDVTPYELMKIRILNGGHAVIAYPAGLMDIHFVHEAMEHPLIDAFLTKLEQGEIIPTVPAPPGMVLAEYFQTIRARFANPKIGDTVARLCFDGSNRQPKFIIPTIADRVASGHGAAGLALESALWCRYCAGTTDSGAAIEANDPDWDRLTAVAQAARHDPAQWLAMADIYGDLGDDAAFAAAFAHALNALWADGTAAVLQRYVDGAL
jgi:mannitol 2-dehydrogenase